MKWKKIVNYIILVGFPIMGLIAIIRDNKREK